MLETFDKQQLLLPMPAPENILHTSDDIGAGVVCGICIKGNKIYLVPLKSDALNLRESPT